MNDFFRVVEVILQLWRFHVVCLCKCNQSFSGVCRNSFSGRLLRSQFKINLRLYSFLYEHKALCKEISVHCHKFSTCVERASYRWNGFNCFPFQRKFATKMRKWETTTERTKNLYRQILRRKNTLKSMGTIEFRFFFLIIKQLSFVFVFTFFAFSQSA